MRYLSVNHSNKKELKKYKIIYFVDELSIFLVSIAAVLLSDLVAMAVNRGISNVGDVFITWPQLLIASLITIITYGSMYTNFNYSDKSKPPWIKRAANGALQGIAWKSLVSIGNAK
jgi:hypothetical protein